ncbi:hypothetical protein PIIN_09057 [Serendipita indica DSM 11827]|uniref:Fungal N-terminal domain-containing protein n=1 Tax=Serendipita indica (strain DSM 11827) TaxID=1109443 RepID=G4TUS9_SERID|nr:hypothetical protein PIIN_09057 [Serendipita indica DSM 11827]
MIDQSVILSLFTSSARLAVDLNGILEGYQSSNETLRAMSTECYVLSIALERVQEMVSSGNQHERLTAIRPGLECALRGCRATLSAIWEEIQSLHDGSRTMGQSKSWFVSMGMRARFRFLWHEGLMNRYLRQLGAQHQALQTLLHVYSLYVPP